MEKVMVVPRDSLFGKKNFEGFMHIKDGDYESRILKHYKFMDRDLAEKDINHKQPIAYCIIVNPDTKKVFAYCRSPKKSKESRLHNKWSWGIGGHINPQDTSENPIHTSMLRELAEEVHVPGSIKPRLLGYVNYDTDEVGQVHFGLLYLIETDAKTVIPKGSEIDNGSFRSLDELHEIIANHSVENWSKISLQPLKQYLETTIQK